MSDRGLTDPIVAAAVGVTATVGASLPIAVLAVSEQAARQANFAAAIFASILSFGAVLAWFARTAHKAVRKLDAIEGLPATVEDLKARAERMEARQLATQEQLRDLSQRLDEVHPRNPH